MTTDTFRTTNTTASPLALLPQQRSHVLFVLSQPQVGRESAFLAWYQGAYRQAVVDHVGVLRAQHYERHDVDITRGRFAPLPFRYLGLYELSIDGAETAAGLIDRITQLHREQAAAQAPATWLYYPVSEKVGRSPAARPSLLTLAFANGVPGQEAEFREWYATRHIRHALKIPALVSGQCLERTQFQRPGALEATFHTIAVYEQEGTPEDFLKGHAALPKGSLPFPMLDLAPSRFAEWVYRPVSDESTRRAER
jgi:hypothetical protein